MKAGTTDQTARNDEKPLLSVVVPCFNEASIILDSFERLRSALADQSVSWEVIFGNDGSSDGTLELIQTLAEGDARVRVTNHYPNRGAGYTYREMYADARGDIILQMDADMAMPPEETLPKLLKALEGADVAVGSRYMGVEVEYPIKRRVFSRGYTMLTRLLFHLDITDTQTGFLGFYKKILPDLDLQADGFELLVEFIAQANARGYRIAEVGVPWYHDITSGETDVWRESVRMLSGTLRVKRRFNRFVRNHDAG